jgi:hypothetical protein
MLGDCFSMAKRMRKAHAGILVVVVLVAAVGGDGSLVQLRPGKRAVLRSKMRVGVPLLDAVAVQQGSKFGKVKLRLDDAYFNASYALYFSALFPSGP